jgi:hypothetical protein
VRPPPCGGRSAEVSRRNCAQAKERALAKRFVEREARKQTDAAAADCAAQRPQ